MQTDHSFPVPTLLSYFALLPVADCNSQSLAGETVADVDSEAGAAEAPLLTSTSNGYIPMVQAWKPPGKYTPRSCLATNLSLNSTSKLAQKSNAKTGIKLPLSSSYPSSVGSRSLMGSSPNVHVPIPQLHPVIEPEPEIKPKKEKVQCSSPISLTRHYFEDLIPTMTTGSLEAQSKGPQDCDKMQNHVEPSLPMTEEVPYSAAWIQRSYSTLVLTFRFGFGCVTRVCMFASQSESCACLLFLALSRVHIS